MDDITGQYNNVLYIKEQVVNNMQSYEAEFQHNNMFIWILKGPC